MEDGMVFKPYAAQDYANRLSAHLSRYYQPPREMTAADLGLSLLQSYRLAGYQGWGWWEIPSSDSPYSFWLGREAA
jgi:hypothetical protein